MTTVPIQQAITLALQHHAAGRLAEAEEIYRRILSVEPRHAESLHGLGIIAQQVGRPDVAVTMIQQAIALVPHNPTFHSNLGEAHRKLGQHDEAVAAYRAALDLKPDLAEAHSNLGNVLRQRGQLEEAIAACRRAVQLRPDYAEAYSNLGNALSDRRDMEEAIECYRRALTLRPDFAEAHNNLAVALTARGQVEESIAACRRALQLQPDYAEAHNNLGCALRELGQLDKAVAALRRALALQPDYATAQCNLGLALRDEGRTEEALAACRRALDLQPGNAAAHTAMGLALRDQGRLDESIAAFRAALAAQPDHIAAHNNLATLLKDQGDVAGALACYREGLSRAANVVNMHSNLVYTMLFDPSADPAALREEAARWDERHAAPLRASIEPFTNVPEAGRRLKVGYVSPDFSGHVISHFFIPLLEAHDRSAFEIHCYSSVRRPDAITAHLRRSADGWRDVLGRHDESVAAQIRTDGIDILVDLTQHMACNRMLLFAMKPAPVQVAWLGYPGSTGLHTMDYRLTDTYMEPEGAPWSESVETPVRLPDSWFCFAPVQDYPVTGSLPALREGYVTFGSLNNFCKMNDAVLSLWSRILQAVDGSRLLIRCPEGSTAERTREFFASRGIGPERVQLVTWTATRAEFLDLFQRIDIALDPFPYNGGTTTCDALWMGIPVLALAGSSIVSRIGVSILSATGLPELLADSDAAYVELAARLALDLPRLAELRATLRARMQASPFMDAQRFARSVEKAYRDMWRNWCQRQDS